MIIFTHVAKSSGSSIKAGIRSNFKNPCWGGDIASAIQPMSIYEHILNNIPIKIRPDIVSNHLPHGIHTLFEEKCSYFTFLRNPISRAISCFYHKSPVTRLRREGFSILKILRWCLQENINCDVMTRQLSGIDDLKKLILSEKTKRQGGFYYVGTKSKPYSDKDMQQMLRKAKYNLTHHYDFVGFQENSFADMERLCDHYGWDFGPRSFLKQKTKSHPDWQTKSVIDVIKKMNKYDIELYSYAKDRF